MRKPNTKELFPLILVSIAVVIWPVNYFLYRTLYVDPFVRSHLPGVNYEPFFSTGYGIVTIAVWIAIVSLLIVFGLKSIHWTRLRQVKPKRKSNTAGTLLAITLLLTAVSWCFSASEASWKLNWNYVDVVAIADEEFRANPDWVEDAEQTLERVNEERFARFQIEFDIRGWRDWDSDDAKTDTFDLYQEAIHECGLPIAWIELDPVNVPGLYGWGFIDQSEWIDEAGNTWWVDLLLIFTGQDCNIQGLSVPRCNAMLIRYDNVNLHAITHELGHQYYLMHCGDPWCVMNVDWQWGDNFCGTCSTELNANRDKWKDHHIFVDEESEPLGRDEWTEPSEDPPEGWTAGHVWTTLSRSDDARLITSWWGQYSVQGFCSSRADAYTFVAMTRGSLGHISCYHSEDFKKLNYWMKWLNTLGRKPWYLVILLYSSTPNHYVRAELNVEFQYQEEDRWELISLPLGVEETAEHGDYSKTWEKWGDWVDSDWQDINKISFSLWWQGKSGGDGTLRIDMMYFSRNKGQLHSTGGITEGIFYRLPERKDVTLRAIPHSGFEFDFWVVCNDDEGWCLYPYPTENPYTITLDASYTLDAHYKKKSSNPGSDEGGIGGDGKPPRVTKN